MNVVVFSTKPYDRDFLLGASGKHAHAWTFLEPRLTRETVGLAKGFEGVCVFVNDQLNAGVLTELSRYGVRLVALRCAGFNNVDLEAAQRLGIRVVRVPAYSPHAVAEHTVGLILMLNRNLHRAYSRVREGNFALGGLLGFDLHGRTVGIVGAGQIGQVFAQIMGGFGCRLIAYDPYPSEDCRALGVEFMEFEALIAEADILSLHCPLTPDTHHLINAQAIAQMKPGVMILNTSRGAVIDTKAVIGGLKTGQIGYLGLDVYEEEADFFFEDFSGEGISDDTLARLLTFPNVVVTGHQAFFTRDALTCIAETTLQNITAIENGEVCANEVVR